MPKQIPDERVFTAAVAVMAQQGYVGATTRQIAEAAGVNEVTLFRRFKSKANLLRAALIAEVEAFEREDVLDTGDIEADLRRIVHAYQRLLGRHGRIIPVVLSEASRNPELREVLEVPRRLLGRIAALLAAYQQRGLLRHEPPLQAVACLIAPLLMPSLLGELPDPAFRDPLDPAAHVEAFLHGRTKSVGEPT